METQNTNNVEGSKLTVPGAIVVAGILIAIALIYTGRGRSNNIETPPSKDDLLAARGNEQEKMMENIRPVSADEHILGDPNAKVKIVEFSDIECPFCKRFHPTMHQIMDEYGKAGKVAWVYRHFPLQIHPKATPEAEATECAWQQGGNDLFWKYLDKLFEQSLSNNQTDDKVPAQVAQELGLDMAKYTKCVTDRTYKSKIEQQIQDGLNSGVSGTPYSIVIASNGKKFPINGALPYDSVKKVIEKALAEK